jgi:aminopeptidase N
MWYLLSANTTFAYTHADSLRGSNGPGRKWWDVTRYDLQVAIDTNSHTISGTNQISFRVTDVPHDSMQIDLQEPMILDSVVLAITDGVAASVNLPLAHEGNVWWVTYPFHKLEIKHDYAVMAYYHGAPRKAVNPPWDGGFSWTHDKEGKAWVAVSCQGLGASVWWPCKDAQWDEPDQGMAMRFFMPGMQVISNGRQLDVSASAPRGSVGLSGWEVKNPINNYDVTFYAGDYVHWHDTLIGEKGKLDLDFYALRYNEEKAKEQFAVVKQMIHCFEYWMGPYPFYEDGYKLVEAPYLGMEHQSAVAYGNNYKMGYMGFDRTFTGVGMNFDYIIVHESGHEWFGNSITAKDMADNWIHEGITTFSESLFAECLLGKEKAYKYARGEWMNIRNDKPVIGDYCVNEEGSGDMYDKGAAMMHMIRVMTNDDEKFRMMLRGLSKEFYHQTVTTKQVEDYIATHTGLDLTAFFNQYLRSKDEPQLEYSIKGGQLNYKFNNVVAGFSLPLTVTAGNVTKDIRPTGEWQHIAWDQAGDVKFSNDFLIKVKK